MAEKEAEGRNPEEGMCCTHCQSTRFAVVQTYRSYYLCECNQCQQVFVLPRRTKGEAA